MNQVLVHSLLKQNEKKICSLRSNTCGHFPRLVHATRKIGVVQAKFLVTFSQRNCDVNEIVTSQNLFGAKCSAFDRLLQRSDRKGETGRNIDREANIFLCEKKDRCTKVRKSLRNISRIQNFIQLSG